MNNQSLARIPRSSQDKKQLRDTRARRHDMAQKQAMSTKTTDHKGVTVERAWKQGSLASAKNDSSRTSVSNKREVTTTGASTQVNNKQKISELLTLLHTAIQQQQHYPPAATEMEREGTVVLTFTLFPNGTIRHLQIIQSSGTTSLDEAALAAIHDALPFNHVDKYLHASQECTIDVIFKL